MMVEATEGKFFIRSNNEGFLNRQSGVFDKLNVLEASHSVAMSTWKPLSTSDKDDDNDSDDEDSTPDQNSAKTAVPELFKVPVGVAPKRIQRPATSPDYRVHPEKWTKYTLSNVTEESLSEDANSEAAMDFLKSRWKTGSDYEDGDKGGEGKASNDDEKEAGSSGTMLEFGKLLMPEYSVGKSANKALHGASKRQKRSDTDKNGVDGNLPKVKLSFLNSISDLQDTGSSSSPADDVRAGVASCDAPATSVSRTSPTAAIGSTDLQPNAPFRSIRKRRRNIRQTTFDFGDEDDGDDK